MKTFSKAKVYELNGDNVKCPQGFSFMTLAFGPFVPLLRGNAGAFVAYLFALIIISIAMFPFVMVTKSWFAVKLGIIGWHLLFAATYNKSFEKRTRLKGYQLVTNE